MFSFIIPTNADHHSDDQTTRLNLIIDSIEQENIPRYEILLIGQANIDRRHTQVIDFDENIKRGWITKKKNVGCRLAKFDNLVLMHDYVLLYKNWFKGWLAFGLEWEASCNVILNKDGQRFRDLIVFDDPQNYGPKSWYHLDSHPHPDEEPKLISPFLPSYQYNNFKHTYISGTFFLTKKRLMLEKPLDERYIHGDGEDIQWSRRIRNGYKIAFNTKSAVQLLHQKDCVWQASCSYYMSNEYATKDLIKD